MRRTIQTKTLATTHFHPTLPNALHENIDNSNKRDGTNQVIDAKKLAKWRGVPCHPGGIGNHRLERQNLHQKSWFAEPARSQTDAIRSAKHWKLTCKKLVPPADWRNNQKKKLDNLKEGNASHHWKKHTANNPFPNISLTCPSRKHQRPKQIMMKQIQNLTRIANQTTKCPGSSRWNWKLQLGEMKSASTTNVCWIRAIANGWQFVSEKLENGVQSLFFSRWTCAEPRKETTWKCERGECFAPLKTHNCQQNISKNFTQTPFTNTSKIKKTCRHKWKHWRESWTKWLGVTGHPGGIGNSRLNTTNRRRKASVAELARSQTDATWLASNWEMCCNNVSIGELAEPPKGTTWKTEGRKRFAPLNKTTVNNPFQIKSQLSPTKASTTEKKARWNNSNIWFELQAKWQSVMGHPGGIGNFRLEK